MRRQQSCEMSQADSPSIRAEQIEETLSADDSSQAPPSGLGNASQFTQQQCGSIAFETCVNHQADTIAALHDSVIEEAEAASCISPQQT